MSLSFPVVPMKATMRSAPARDSDSLWAYEIKWDGYRTVAHIGSGTVRLQSSNSIDVTHKYPELGELATSVNAGSAILDGELVVLDDEGRPRFELMQQHATDVAFFVFDVLQIDSHDTIELPYEQRRMLLSGLLEPCTHWMVPAHHVAGGAELLQATAALGLEGVVAKRLGSTYQPGKRSPNWIKLKNRRSVEVVIGGYSPGTGSRQPTFGSLLIGVTAPDLTIDFAGAVGTGFDEATLAALTQRLIARRTPECPFNDLPAPAYRKDAVWVTPDLHAIVEIAEFTNEGYVRHASFIRLVD